MKAYKISGKFLMGRRMQPFAIEVASDSEEEAREKTLSVLGSKHRANRRSIDIAAIEVIEGDAITDPTVQYKVRGTQ